MSVCVTFGMNDSNLKVGFVTFTNTTIELRCGMRMALK